MFHIYMDCTTNTTILLFHHHHKSSIVFTTTTTILLFSPPQQQFCCFSPPPPLQFYCFHHRHHQIKDCVVLALAHFIAMSRVVKNNRGFLQILAECSSERRQFLLMTASAQQMHALVQVVCNVLLKHIPVSEEERRKLIQFKNVLVNLAELDVPYKTEKQTLLQEGSNFIQDLLTPVLSSLGFLML